MSPDAIKRSRGGSIVSGLLLLGVAGLGVGEFNALWVDWPDAAMGVAGRQLLAGIMLLGVGGLATSAYLQETPPRRPPPAGVRAGTVALVMGTVLVVSALAGFLFLLCMR